VEFRLKPPHMRVDLARARAGPEFEFIVK
jgi:hypothetical protein